MADTYDITPARIGQFYFKYDQPDVDVTAEANTTEQETIDDNIIVQRLGRRADQITVRTTVADWELKYVDNLVKLNELSLRTERWVGDVVVQSVSTNPMNAVDDTGSWLYEITINCLETGEYEGSDELVAASEFPETPSDVGTGGIQFDDL